MIYAQLKHQNGVQQTPDPQARISQEISELKKQLTSYGELLFQVFQKFSALEQQISVTMTEKLKSEKDSIKK